MEFALTDRRVERIVGRSPESKSGSRRRCYRSPELAPENEIRFAWVDARQTRPYQRSKTVQGEKACLNNS